MSEGDPGDKYFDSSISDRERAIFEGGITLGALYHQFIGTPIGDKETLESAIEESALSQPYIIESDVKIVEIEKEGRSQYSYTELSGKSLQISLISKYGEAKVEMELREIPELDYPLMLVKKIF